MLEYLKFSLGNGQQGYKVVRLEPSVDSVTYEIIHSGLLSIDRGRTQKQGTADWLAVWETLGVSAWDEEYFDPAAASAEEWRLSVQEDGIIYKCGG